MQHCAVCCAAHVRGLGPEDFSPFEQLSLLGLLIYGAFKYILNGNDHK